MVVVGCFFFFTPPPIDLGLGRDHSFLPRSLGRPHHPRHPALRHTLNPPPPPTQPQPLGLFIKCAKEVSEKYAGTVDVDFHIVDNAAQQLVQRPTQYSVILTSNLYGAVLGNILAGVCGGAGLLPGANIGPDASVWEQGARHVGRDIAGKGLANPTAALLSAGMMLRHLSLSDYCDRLEDAVLGAIADSPASAKTPDIGGTGGTKTLMSAVLERIE